MDLRQQIKAFTPWNEQEATDKQLLLARLEEKDVFIRANKVGHFTASGWVVSPDRQKVLMVYHNIYDSWAWMGGHADGETDLRAVAEREIQEESGIRDLRLLDEEIFSLEVLTVDGHEKKGQYVSSHLHYNVTYLFEADTEQETALKPDENSGVRWIKEEDLVKMVSEPWFLERIYSKLCDKVRNSR